jgi:hypothetical protein
LSFIDGKNRNQVAILIGNGDKLARWVECEMSRCPSTTWDALGHRQLAGCADPKHAQTVVAPVSNEEKPAVPAELDLRAVVVAAYARNCGGDRNDGKISVHRIEGKRCNGRVELVYGVDEITGWAEYKVPGTRSRRHGRGTNLPDGSALIFEPVDEETIESKVTRDKEAVIW